VKIKLTYTGPEIFFIPKSVCVTNVDNG